MGRLKIAFVGSGGAARGLAHLGVLKACEELGILPEIFVGASAGALVGATYGQDIPLDVMMDGYRLPWRRRHTGLWTRPRQQRSLHRKQRRRTRNAGARQLFPQLPQRGLREPIQRGHALRIQRRAAGPLRPGAGALLYAEA